MKRIKIDYDINDEQMKFERTSETSGTLIIKIKPFKNQLIKIFNHMNHIEGDYVRFILSEEEKILFEIQIRTVLCTTIVLVSYKDKVKMFNKDSYNFDYYTMFEKIEKWSNMTLEGGVINSSSIDRKYWYL